MLAVASATSLSAQTVTSGSHPTGPCALVVDEPSAPLRQDVTWILRKDAKERRKLDDQCRAVGPVVLRAAPGRGSAPVIADSVAVVVWNVHVGGGDIVALVRRLESGALTGTPVSHYVLLLEEVHRAGGHTPQAPHGVRVPRRIAPQTRTRVRDDIVSVARTLNLALYYVPSMRNGSGTPFEDRGNAILSTVHLEALTAIELPFARQRRVAIGATIRGVTRDHQMWALRVVAVHLDALAGASRLWVFGTGWRARQARTVMAALGDSDPSVLGGDLNTWCLGKWEPAYRGFAQAYPQTRTTATPRGETGHGRLDYVFYRLPNAWASQSWRPRDACATGEAKCGSDHRPIIGTVSFLARVAASNAVDIQSRCPR